MTSTLIRNISSIDARIKAGARAVMKKKTVAAGIDAGTRTTKTALVGMQGGRAVIHSLADEHGGPSAATASLANERADMCVCGLSGHEVRTFLQEFPPMPKGELKILVRRSIAQSLKTEPEVAFEVEPHPKGKDEVLAVSASREHIESAFAALADSGIAVDAAFADVTALAECVRAAYPGAEGQPVCIFNMGATWSELALLDRGRLVFSRSIKMGLKNLIETTADLCGVSIEDAQQLVFSTGAAVSFQEADQDDLMGRTYAESVRDVIEQIVVEVHRSLSFASMRHGLASPEVVLLCGGASLVPGMASVLGRDTGTRVEVFDPLDYMQKGDDVDASVNGSIYCVAIGLGLLALRSGSPAFMPPGLPEKPAIENHLATALILAAVALAAIFVTGRVLDSSSERYAAAVGTENLVLESLGDWVAEGPAPAEPGTQARAYAYSLLSEPSPAWRDILMVVSNTVPEGVILDQITFTRSGQESGQISDWSMMASGIVTDMDNTATLLNQLVDSLEESGIFRDVGVLPQGSTTFTHRGRRYTEAIRFELTAGLE